MLNWKPQENGWRYYAKQTGYHGEKAAFLHCVAGVFEVGCSVDGVQIFYGRFHSREIADLEATEAFHRAEYQRKWEEGTIGPQPPRAPVLPYPPT